MKERPLLYLALFLGIGSLIFIGSNNIEIRNYFENFQYEPLVESLNGKQTWKYLYLSLYYIFYNYSFVHANQMHLIFFLQPN